MDMANENPYRQAHVVVAGIRVFEHVNTRPPSLLDLAGLLQISSDEVSRITRKLETAGIIGTVRSGGEERFLVADYLKIEDLPRAAETPKMNDEIKDFQARQRSRMGEIEQFLKDKDKKPDLFSQLDQALKNPASTKKKNPLD